MIGRVSCFGGLHNQFHIQRAKFLHFHSTQFGNISNLIIETSVKHLPSPRGGSVR